jgi:uncharacterized protein (TIGR03435 family)
MALQAYGLKAYQFPAGAFDDKTTFHVVARVPPAATKEQVLQMLQGLLGERLKLAFHFEKRPMPVIGSP